MFDIGFAELVLLAMVALLVLGPERLPGVARALGGLSRKARSSWLNLKRSIEAEMRAEELKKPLQQFQDEIKKTRDTFSDGIGSIRGDMTALDAKVTALSNPPDPHPTDATTEPAPVSPGPAQPASKPPANDA